MKTKNSRFDSLVAGRARMATECRNVPRSVRQPYLYADFYSFLPCVVLLRLGFGDQSDAGPMHPVEV